MKIQRRASKGRNTLKTIYTILKGIIKTMKYKKYKDVDNTY